MKRFLGPTLGAMRCLGLLLAAALSACSDVVAPVAVRATSDLPPAGVPFSITPALSTPLDAVAGSAGGRLLGTPFVLVQDRFGTALAGVSVAFSPGANGGRVTGGEQVTSPSGVASPGGWTLGPAMERYSLIATGGKATLTLTRAPASGPPAIIIPIKGDHQVTFPGVPVAERPFVTVADSVGRSIEYAVIDWRNGSDAVVCQNLVLRGIAEFNCAWTPGDAPGVYTLTAVVGVARGVITATVIARPSVSVRP